MLAYRDLPFEDYKLVSKKDKLKLKKDFVMLAILGITLPL